MPPTDQRCETCLYYLSGQIGHCNRHPPVIVLFAANAAAVPDDYRSVWPKVAPDDWCGEWATKSIAGQ
jgi:hypothetical protein